MSKGVNRLSGRNNNKMDLNPDGSIIVSSVGSSITFNTDTPLQINSIESFTEKTSIVIPNLNQTSSNFEVTVDIIPSTNSKSTGSLTETKPTPEPNLLTLENQFLPDIEENFNFVNLFTNDNINIEIEWDNSITTATYSSPPNEGITYEGDIVKDAGIRVDGVAFRAQPTNWTCLVISTVNIFEWESKRNSKYKSLNLNSFPNLTNSGGGGKYLKGTEFQTGIIQNNYKNFTQIRKKGYSGNTFEDYKTFFRQVKKPIIIRIAGVGARSRGHYVTMVGITKGGNIIIHDSANKNLAKKEQVIGANRILKFGEPNNGVNYHILYIQ